MHNLAIQDTCVYTVYCVSLVWSGGSPHPSGLYIAVFFNLRCQAAGVRRWQAGEKWRTLTPHLEVKSALSDCRADSGRPPPITPLLIYEGGGCESWSTTVHCIAWKGGDLARTRLREQSLIYAQEGGMV